MFLNLTIRKVGTKRTVVPTTAPYYKYCPVVDFKLDLLEDFLCQWICTFQSPIFLCPSKNFLTVLLFLSETMEVRRLLYLIAYIILTSATEKVMPAPAQSVDSVCLN